MAPCTLSRTVFFVGFMGAGKTSVSRRLARMCGLSSVDMDTYIERREGKKVAAIFDEVGEAGFRAIEAQVMREFAQGDPLLVSCGGGVVVTPDNREVLSSDSGFTVYLKVSADEAKNRISDLSTRPLFTDIESARRRNAERAPLYESVADATVETAGKGVTAIAREVRGILERNGVLCR